MTLGLLAFAVVVVVGLLMAVVLYCVRQIAKW
jgi:hypothetical protein